MPKPITRSRTAQTMLEAAAARDDHRAVPPEHLPTAARRAVVQSLLKVGLVEEVVADNDGPAWRTTESGERLALRSTGPGLAAVGAGGAPAEQVEAREPEVDTPPPPVSERPKPEALVTTGVLVAQPAPARSGLRAIAQAVVAAWDDPSGNRPNMPNAIEALRTTLASMTVARTRTLTGTPRQSRTNTKRAAVLTLLRRPEGATITQVTNETGWATHTVRGFFAGLKKAGIPVDVLERVRQVGPGKEGAKGSYTVYHVAEEA